MCTGGQQVGHCHPLIWVCPPPKIGPQKVLTVAYWVNSREKDKSMLKKYYGSLDELGTFWIASNLNSHLQFTFFTGGNIPETTLPSSSSSSEDGSRTSLQSLLPLIAFQEQLVLVEGSKVSSWKSVSLHCLRSQLRFLGITNKFASLHFFDRRPPSGTSS